MYSRFSLMFASLLLLGLALAACGGRASQQAGGSEDYTLTLNPMSTAVGQTMLMLTLNDKNGQPVNNATLSLKGDMNHAGMQPVLAETTQGLNGVYSVPFEWTMGGDWFVTVEVALPDGTTFSQRFDGLRISSQMSGQLDVMNVWGRPALVGNNTAFYMNLSNGTPTADALTGAEIGVCDVVELHETYDRGEGMMGMRPVENGRIPLTSGGIAQLKPGGLHVMCIGVNTPLAVGDDVPVTLLFEQAGRVSVTAEIAEMMDMTIMHHADDGHDHDDHDHDDHDHDDDHDSHSHSHSGHDHDAHQLEMKTIPNNGAVIRLLSPVDGATFDDHDHITIEVATENFPLTEGNHWHIYLNDEPHEMVEGGATTYRLDHLKAGTYVIRVTMSNADHDELEEGASVTITVE